MPFNQLGIYEEDDLLPISALQHLMFCERQWALIHLEQIWEDNRLTAEGQQLHEKANSQDEEKRNNLKIVRTLRLRSLKYGLTGVADIVEFHKQENNVSQPYPIEYKRGKPKSDLCDSVQLCAQALCLEEMLGVKVLKGAFFYWEIKRRLEIEIDYDLRLETYKLIQRLHHVTKARKTPPAKLERKCTNCSLINWCMPSCTNGSKSIKQYLGNVVKWATEDDEKDGK